MATLKMLAKIIAYLMLWAVMLALPLALMMPVLKTRWPEQALMLFGDGTIALTLIVATIIFARFVDRRPLADFTLGPRGLVRAAGLGALIGAMMTAVTAGFLLFAGGGAVGAGVGVTSWSALLLAMVWSLVNCFAQEFLVRGYVFMTLARAWGGAAAVVVTAVIFVAIHGVAWAGTREAWLLAGDIFGAGLVLGACVLLTRSIWLATGVHFAWNFLQPIVFGADHIYWGFGGVEGSVVALPAKHVLEADPAAYVGLLAGVVAVAMLWVASPLGRRARLAARLPERAG